jgi:hypothetical protein
LAVHAFAASGLFAALLKLLLERRELGERRIGIRLLVAIFRAAKRLCVILLALGAFDPVAFVASRRAIATLRVVFALEAFALTLDALLALLTRLALLAIAGLLVFLPLGGFRSCWRCCGFGRNSGGGLGRLRWR